MTSRNGGEPAVPGPRDTDEPGNERAAADARLIAELARTQCDGPLWDATRRRLARLGLGVLHQLVLHGGMEARSRALGRPITLTAEQHRVLRDDEHQRGELVDEAVTKGLDLFRRRTVLGGEWTAGGGASIDVYFVNGCILALANPVRAWKATLSRDVRVDVVPDDELEVLVDGVGSLAPDPADEILGHEDLAAAVDLLGSVLARAALLKIFTGWSWDRVAEEIGQTPSAFEQRLRRFRRRHDHRRPADTQPTEEPEPAEESVEDTHV